MGLTILWCLSVMEMCISVATALTLKSTAFVELMPSNVEVHLCFRGTYCLHPEDWVVSEAGSQQQASAFSLFIFEGGGSMFLWNVSDLPDISLHSRC
jgi:hypothetical protein